MLKKINFDDTIKKAEDISDKVNIIMRNRLIIAIFLIVDGITFIMNPNTSLAEMARNIIIIVLLTSLSTLITNIASKTKDLKAIIMSIAIIVIGIILYIYPDLISAYIQIVFAIFIIFDGLINILNALNMNKLSMYTQGITKKLNKIVNNKDDNNDVDKKFYDGIEEQKEKLMNPLNNIVNKTKKASILYIVINIASIILGVILLIFPDTSMIIWGCIFIYTGTSNLLFAMKTMNISKKIKEKKFKEILYNEDKKDEQNKTDME